MLIVVKPNSMKSGVELLDVTSLRTLISFRSSGSEKNVNMNRRWLIPVVGIREMDTGTICFNSV